MGLSSDPNKTIPILNNKAHLLIPTQSNDKSEWREEAIENKIVSTKKHVAEALEREAKAPRIKLFRLPNSQVEWITYLMDKYGTDYKEMAKDKKNYYQETWKQLRAKIKRFKSIPEQYSKYLEERGLSAEQFDGENEQDIDSD